jgi:hypothetical protein
LAQCLVAKGGISNQAVEEETSSAKPKSKL